MDEPKQTTPERSPTRILILDDHPIVRQALKHLLNDEPGVAVCAEAAGGAEAVRMLTEEQPDLVLLDLALRTGDGLSLIRQMSAACPQIPILVLSLHSEVLFAERAIRAGASGYVMKSDSPDRLLEAVQQLLKGEIYVSDELRESLLHRTLTPGTGHAPASLDILSDRELEVFQLIGQGYSTAQIAETLARSVKTIETHRAHIKRKLGLPNNTLLVNRATRWVLQDQSA